MIVQRVAQCFFPALANVTLCQIWWFGANQTHTVIEFGKRCNAMDVRPWTGSVGDAMTDVVLDCRMPERMTETALPASIAASGDPGGQSAPLTGLVLSGGGARAAYQVGVLKAIAQLVAGAHRSTSCPFQVLVGTSAGAINATALASGADNFGALVARIANVWENFRAEQVYRADAFGVVRSGARWLSTLSLGWALFSLFGNRSGMRPRSLLDNAPLEALLERMIDAHRIEDMLAARHLHALAVTVSSYTSGQHVTFYQCREAIAPWTRSQRLAVRAPITTAHLLASSAIPFMFPARELVLAGRREFFGDGSMRQLAPISPAIHLGAEKVLVVGAGRLHEPPLDVSEAPPASYPTLAQIAGHALSSIFLDGLAVDIERLGRINHTLSLLPPEGRERSALRTIDVLVIAPSERLDDIAARHIASLPRPVRALLGAIGVEGSGRASANGVERRGASGAALASYLLFEADYTRELIALGVADTMVRKDEVLRFLGASGRSAQ